MLAYSVCAVEPCSPCAGAKLAVGGCPLAHHNGLGSKNVRAHLDCLLLFDGIEQHQLEKLSPADSIHCIVIEWVWPVLT